MLFRSSASHRAELDLFTHIEHLEAKGDLHPDDTLKVLTAEQPAIALQEILARRQSERALLDRMIEFEGMSDVTGAPLIDADDALRAATDSDPDKALRYLEARAKSNATDAQLGQDLDGSFKVAADGTKYVDQLYDVITLGAGFAGIANELHEIGRAHV